MNQALKVKAHCPDLAFEIHSFNHKHSLVSGLSPFAVSLFSALGYQNTSKSLPPSCWVVPQPTLNPLQRLTVDANTRQIVIIYLLGS